MKNGEIARIFEELADLLEYEGESVFKLNAYRKGARVVRDLTEDIEAVAREGRLKELSGIGDALAKKILEYVETGRMSRYEEARAAVPPGILDIMRLPGLGPKTAALLHRHLKISTLSELEEAARNGRIRELGGMGEKKEENILRSLEKMAAGGQRMLLGEALPLVERLIAELRRKGIDPVVYAGSLRRMRETIGDLDILAASSDGPAAVHAFCRLPEVAEVLAEGPTKGSVLTKAGRQVDLRVVDPSSFGAALQYFTGSKSHNVRLRDLAKRMKLKVNEYGLFDGERRVAGESEEGMYEALGLAWIPPELREDRGEIDAAAVKRLPALVEASDIRGDLHAHTNWSDGRAEIEDMARAAKARGYEYLAISDHSKALKIFGGLTAERLADQIEAVREAARRVPGIRLLTGIEVDIKSDGSLDLPDAVLATLDVVTASVHSGFKQGRAQMTERILGAVRNPHVDVIGHPTGRLIGSRDPYEVDLDAVIREAARCGKALEVNSHPERLDLNDQGCRRAKELGARIVINTDAHDTDQLDTMRFGVATARRGWIERADVVNALPLPGLLAWLARA